MSISRLAKKKQNALNFNAGMIKNVMLRPLTGKSVTYGLKVEWWGYNMNKSQICYSCLSLDWLKVETDSPVEFLGYLAGQFDLRKISYNYYCFCYYICCCCIIILAQAENLVMNNAWEGHSII